MIETILAIINYIWVIIIHTVGGMICVVGIVLVCQKGESGKRIFGQKKKSGKRIFGLFLLLCAERIFGLFLCAIGIIIILYN